MNGIDSFALDERDDILEPKQKKLQLGFADYSQSQPMHNNNLYSTQNNNWPPMKEL